jgi:methionine-rich copper-binding protein CopC
MANINKDKLSIIVPSSTIATTASITVNATTQGVEHELIYSESQATASIVESISHEIGVEFQEPMRKQIFEEIEIRKKYVSDFELDIKWTGVSLKIKRSPQKVIKNFIQEKK